MKGLPQWHSAVVPILLIELVVFLRIIGFRCRGHQGRLLQYEMIPHFHEDAFRICGELGIDNLESWHPISSPFARLSARVSVDKDLSFLGNIHAFNTDLSGMDDIGSSQCLCQGSLFLLD